MKLLVCYKVIPDLDQVLWDEDVLTSDMGVDTSYVKNIINCFDESSLEFGLRLSDEAESLNLHIEKSALTVADKKAELVMQTLNALQYDHVIRFNPEKDIRFAPDAVGQQIVNYVKENPQELILMGRQSPEGNNFATAQFVAEELNMPFMPNVVDIHFTDHETLLVQQEVGGAVYEHEITGPVVCTIGNAIISKLRVPTLKNRMKFGKRPCELPEFTYEEQLYHAYPEMITYVDRRRAGKIVDVSQKNGMELIETILKESEGFEKNSCKEKVIKEDSSCKKNLGKLLIVSCAKEKLDDIWLNDYLNLKDQWEHMGYDTNLYLYVGKDEKIDEKYSNCFGKIYLDDSWYFTPSVLADHISDMVEADDITGVFVMEDSLSNEIAGSLAIKMGWECVINGIDIEKEEGKLRLSKMVYNNNIKSELVLPEEKFVISSGTLKSRKYEGNSEACNGKNNIFKVKTESCPSFILSQKLLKGIEQQKTSDILIAVGQGVETKQNVEKLREWAKARGYMFGVSRPVAMSGWGTMEEIIGVSGNIHTPKLTIAIGVSGTAAFYAGIEQSDKIVAINTSEKAAIIKMSDLSIIEDYKNIFQEILE